MLLVEKAEKYESIFYVHKIELFCEIGNVKDSFQRLLFSECNYSYLNN